MKRCPFCGAENRDVAVVCYNCGRGLPAVDPLADQTEPTQPLHRRPQPPSQGAQNYSAPPTESTQSYTRHHTQPYTPGASSAEQTQYSGQAYSAGPTPYPGAQPQYPGGQPPYTGGQPPYSGGQPPYIPPPPAAPSPYNPGSNRVWQVLALALGALLLCAGCLAVWTLTSASYRGVTNIGSQWSTQVADVFTAPTKAPVATSIPTQPAEPTAWPTFTLLPTATDQPTQPPAEGPSPTPNATQQSNIKKLLSPECSSALDELGKVSDKASSNPLVLLDENWRSGFNQAMSDMKTNCGSLDAASPIPGEISEVRRNLDLASSEYDQAKQIWSEAVDQRDPGKLLSAGQHLTQATGYLNEAIKGLKKVVP